MLIYIHGFNSSAASYKAQALKSYLSDHNCQQQIVIPDLSAVPSLAIKQLEEIIATNTEATLSFIGSSLGGYYATYLAVKYSAPAVLVNPAVKPYELLVDYLGENTNLYTGETYTLNATHIKELSLLDVKDLTAYRQIFFLLLQTGDEILDYKQAKDKFLSCKQIIEAGGDHSFNSFEYHLPAILEFCNIKLS